MAVIEGYTFAVDMQDRGVVTTLRQMRAAASAMKSEMRTGFETIRQGEGDLSAYNFKIQQSERQIENYKNMQVELRKELDRLADKREKEIAEVRKYGDSNTEEAQKVRRAFDTTEKSYASIARQIENTQHQINRLNSGIEASRREIEGYRNGLNSFRNASIAGEQALNSYNSLLKAQGNNALKTRGQLHLLLSQRQTLQRQTQLETANVHRLQDNLSKMQGEYSSQASALRRVEAERAKVVSTVGKESAQYKALSDKIAKLRGSQNELSTNVSRATSNLQRETNTASRTAVSFSKVNASIRSIGTGRLGAISRELNNISVRARVATSNTRNFANSLRGSFYGAVIGVGALSVGVGHAVKLAANLQQSWITTRNLLQTGAKSAREAQREVSQVGTMQHNATKYSKEYGFSQKEIADQYTELVKRGYNAHQSLGSMRSMLEAARASGDDYSDVVKNVASTLDAFGLRQNKTSSQVISNSKRVTNAMAYAADMTATDFKGMGFAMSYVSTSAHQAGFDVEQTAAAIGELSNAGIEGTKAGTGLRKTINSLLAPTAAAQEALHKYGMSVDDFRDKSGKLKSLPKIMEIINKHTKDLGKADKGAFFKAVFGTTGQQAAETLAQSSKAMADLVTQERKAEKNNYVNRLAEKNMASTQMQAKILKQNLDAIAIDIGSTLLPQMNKVIKAFSQWAESTNGQRSLKEFKNEIAATGRVIGNNAGSIMNFLGGFAKGLMDVFGVTAKVVGSIGKLVSWIGKFTGTGSNAPRILGEITGGLLGLTAVVKTFGVVFGGVSAIAKDFKNLMGWQKQTQEIKEQDSLYERMIQLQERSLEISEAQARAQGINTESLGKSVAAEDAETVVGGASGKREEVKIRPTLDERGTSKISSWFERTLPAFGGIGGSTAGAKATNGFLGKFKALPGKIKSMGVFGSIANLAMGAWTAFDMSKDIYNGLTSSKAKNRYEGAGKTIAAGVGWYLGGPFAGQMAEFGMDWAYRSVNSFKKGWDGYTRNYKPRGFVATVGWDFKDASRRYNNWVASVEKHHPIIAGYFRWERGTFDTAFATVKFFARHIHNSMKELWDGVSDIARGRFSKLWADTDRDHKNMVRGIKNDWRGFFDWFGKNRQKESLHKPSKDSRKSSASSESSKVKSLGNTRYSSSDVKNLKAMTAQIGSYEKALKGLKATIRTNDPTAELRHMNRELKGASSNWGKVAKPIQKIGDAFKYLSRFTSSMSKKDAFAALNRDLPKLDSTVKKYGKSLTSNINSLGKSLKKNSLQKPLKELDKEIQGSIKKWKEFSSPVKSLAKSFRTLQSATKALTGKNGLESTKKGFTDLNNALRKQKIGSYMKKLANDLKRSKVTSYLTSMNKSVRNSAKYWRSLATPVKKLAGSFSSLQKAVRNLSGRRNGFSALNRDIQTLYRTIRRNPFGKLIAQQANIANRALSGKKSGFVNEFNRQTRSMERSLRSFRRTFTRDWEDTWRGLSRPVSRNLSEAYRAERRSLNDMESARSKFSNSFLKGWDSWINSVTSNFRRGFDKLPGYAQSSMKDIISRLNKGISGINSTISSFGGDKKLSTISYANGTQGGHPGGHMLVNDSVRPHWKELVLFPNGQALLPQHRNTLIPNAPRGTQVLSGENTYKFMNSIGVHKYANGTLSDEEMDKLSEQFEKHPEQASKELILKLTNWNSKVPVVADFGEASAVAFSRGIANKLKDLIGAVKQPVNGDWTPVIRSAAAKMGVSLSAGDISHIITVIMGESGGIQNRRQEVDDVNMREGHPAQGLLQYVPSTFDHYAVAGHHNINSGYDQLLAMFNDATWRSDLTTHGWSPNGPRRMAWGGFANKEQLIHVAEGNLPEAIIPIDINKRPRALSLIDHTLDKMESDGGGTGGLRSRASQTRVDNENATYLKQAVSILTQIAGLNKQQIDAILTHGNDDMNSRHKRAQFYQKFGNDQRVSDYMSY